jgi:hypothetical protein
MGVEGITWTMRVVRALSCSGLTRTVWANPRGPKAIPLDQRSAVRALRPWASIEVTSRALSSRVHIHRAGSSSVTGASTSRVEATHPARVMGYTGSMVFNQSNISPRLTLGSQLGIVAAGLQNASQTKLGARILRLIRNSPTVEGWGRAASSHHGGVGLLTGESVSMVMALAEIGGSLWGGLSESLASRWGSGPGTGSTALPRPLPRPLPRGTGGLKYGASDKASWPLSPGDPQGGDC